MDKQIVFYSDQYQFYYSPKSKTISSPQISGRKRDDYAKNRRICFSLLIVCWIIANFISPPLVITYNIPLGILELPLAYLVIRTFLKVKIYFEFSIKFIWYLFFVPCYCVGFFLVSMAAATSETIINFIVMWCIVIMYVLINILIGLVLTCKKSVDMVKNGQYLCTLENKKMLRDVLISNDLRYKVIIVFEAIVLGLLVYFFFSIGILPLFIFFVPVFIVAVFQRNICYLILIHKIAKQYGISLKSKDVIAENDADEGTS